MEAIRNVEREIDRVISKFGALNDHTTQTLTDLLNQLKSLKQDFVMLSRKWFIVQSLISCNSCIGNFHCSLQSVGNIRHPVHDPGIKHPEDQGRDQSDFIGTSGLARNRFQSGESD